MQPRHRYIALLAVISVLILVLGFIFRPAAPAPSKKRAPDLTVTRAELENLRELVRRNSLRNVAADFTTLASQVFAEIATIRPWGTYAVVMPDRTLTAAKPIDAVPQPITVTSGGSQPYATTNLLWVPGLPFATARVNLSNNDLSPSQFARSAPAQGSWLVLVSDGTTGPTLVSPGVFGGMAGVDCGPFLHRQLETTIPMNAGSIGAGVFDLFGGLQGVVVGCEESPAVIPILEMQQAIALASAPSVAILARYGMRIAASSAATRSAKSSILVTEVWTGWPADLAGINPGDTLVAVDGKTLSQMQDATAALTATAPAAHQLQLRRTTRISRVTLTPVDLTGTAAGPPPAIRAEPSGVRITQVAHGSSAEAAGLRSGDLILQIDGLPATSGRVQRLLSPYRVSRPMAVQLWRPGRRLLVWMQP
ncbi:MAG TPA: PDZ domain-containing protein [Terriglobales bacterium]|nr:PDZ domain-containing protein [Terriglobales bacterium]